MNGFSPAQMDTLLFWRAFGNVYGYPPTQREAGGHFQIGMQAMVDRVNACIRKGGLSRAPGAISRGVILTALGRSATSTMLPAGPTGTVVQEKKCRCGASYFTDETACTPCLRLSTSHLRVSG